MLKKNQKLASYVFGTVFVVVMLAIALFIPNPTSFQYVVFRVVLALAAAGVATMIPGFLEVTIPRIVRAGGALAVFAVVFFYNPASLVLDQDAQGIEPLPEPVVDITLSSAKSVSVLQLLKGEPENKASRVFDVTFSNASDSLVLLTRINIRWRYRRGFAESIESGAVLVPLAKYTVALPVDTEDGTWKSLTKVMSPSIALPPGTPKSPTLITVRLQLYYEFVGRLDYHPGSDWNILFDVHATSPTGHRVSIFKDAKWR